MSVAITVEHVSKRFSRGQRVRTLAESVIGAPRRWLERRNASGLKDHEFWALDDVSLCAMKGEMLGVVGKNGSGKSTLLKLLFRILRPDRGRVLAQGRVGGLIELGAGFHPYLSGRENVFINGAILGMAQREIRARYDSIVEFAGISEFMGMPVKNYSSGMYARLAFAIAAHAAPDVLLVDEVLAVGDTSFQLKCYDWMNRQRKKGTTVILVSHNMLHVSSADRVILLASGRVKRDGLPRDVIDCYQAEQLTLAAPEVATVCGNDGLPVAAIERLEILDSAGRDVESLDHDVNLRFRLTYSCRDPIESPAFEISFFHEDPRYAVTIPNDYLFRVFSDKTFNGQLISGRGSVEVAVESLRLPIGKYRVKVILFRDRYTGPVFVWDGARRIEINRPAWGDGKALLEHRHLWAALRPDRNGS